MISEKCLCQHIKLKAMWVIVQWHLWLEEEPITAEGRRGSLCSSLCLCNPNSDPESAQQQQQQLAHIRLDSLGITALLYRDGEHQTASLQQLDLFNGMCFFILSSLWRLDLLIICKCNLWSQDPLPIFKYLDTCLYRLSVLLISALVFNVLRPQKCILLLCGMICNSFKTK